MGEQQDLELDETEDEMEQCVDEDIANVVSYLQEIAGFPTAADFNVLDTGDDAKYAEVFDAQDKLLGHISRVELEAAWG